MDDILELSRNELHPHGVTSARPHPAPNPQKSSEPAYLVKARLTTRLGSLTKEIASLEESISDLQRVKADLVVEQNTLQLELRTLEAPAARHMVAESSSHARDSGSGVSVESSKIDYMQEFEWSNPLKSKMKKVFGIRNFRLCQEGVCNASMDGRDIVCVMPTGGGKSLTYQLPAIMSPGCTLVISPLISLITDQILHLRQAGVEAVMLTGGTSKEDSREIFSRLTATSRRAGLENDPEIKLCYVTPEKIAKSKTFNSLLEKLASAGKLARIVIDEAHCVSQLGHDFRPDYKKLSILRQLFPYVPILALSATCPPKVLKDLLLTLRLKPVVNGNAADKVGTVYFTAPLYRKNLHYSIVPKPASASAVIEAMAEYILTNHENDSGIVYCLSKKDTETVAQGLIDASKGKVKAGVYHADVSDAQKERLHVKWRNGDVQVVCATIAFGLGIDKANVRFVLHHSMSKSLDGFYQESGRAGRDGNDADCVLYYRGQDASRLSALICGELEGQEKLHHMLHFAQNLTECRKIQFANYFSSSSSLSLSSWSDTTESGALTRCGHCDNCGRPADSIVLRDVTLESWKILKIVSRVVQDGGRVTVSMLADLVRGSGGGSFAGGGRKKGRGKQGPPSKEKFTLNLDEICGGKVTLSKDDVEFLIIQLILSHHLKEDFHSTAYSINVYVTSGPQALRLTRLSREKIEDGEGSRIECTFVNKTTKRRRNSSKSARKGKKSSLSSEDESDDGGGDSEDSLLPSKPRQASRSKPNVTPKRTGKDSSVKGKGVAAKQRNTKVSNSRFKALTDPAAPPDGEDEDDIPWDIDEPRPSRHPASAKRIPHDFAVLDPGVLNSDPVENSSDDEDWSFGLGVKRKMDANSRGAPVAKRSKTTIASSSGAKWAPPGDDEVLVISSD